MTTKTLPLLAAVLGVVLSSAPAVAEDTTKIVGGQPATTDKYPWMVAVINERQSQQHPWRSGCGGALVAPNKVITAAHCVDEDPRENFTIAASRTDLRTDDGTERKVTTIWRHPDYQQRPPAPGEPAVLRPDVAVLTLDRPLSNPTIPLATKHDAALYRPGKPAVVLGWGSTTEPPAPAEPSPTLRQGHVKITADKPCIDAHEQDQSFAQTFAPAHYVCTRDLRHGTTTGGGDSGGPLVVGDKLVAITVSGTFDLEQNYASFTELITFTEELHAQIN